MSLQKQGIITLIMALTMATSLTAQTIQGRVLDKADLPMEGYVSLFIMGDSTNVSKIELTGPDGYFRFDDVEVGDYGLSFSFYGSVTDYPATISVRSVDDVIDLDDLIVQNNDIELGEVLLVHKKPLVEQKMDRTVVNVAAFISNTGTSALEVIEKSPGLRVDDNGSISLKGRSGVSVYINDKPTYLSGSDLAAYLRSLPSSTLEAIEIMTNPPAQYDAAGNAGVINIRTKRQNKAGFNLGGNLSLTQHKYTSTTNGLNLNYRKNKINIYANAGYGTRNGFADLTINRRFMDEAGNTVTDFDQISNIRNKGYQFQSTLGADYYQSDNTTWGIVLGGITRNPESSTITNSSFRGNAGIMDSLTTTNNSEVGDFKNGSVNLNLRHTFREEGPKIGIDLDHIVYGINNDQNFEDVNFDDSDMFRSRELLYGDLSSKLKISSAKVDYTTPLDKSSILSLGAKTSYTETDNAADYFSGTDDGGVPDYDKTNRFRYAENIHAGYVNFNREFKKLTVQMGLRYEQTISKGHQLGNVNKPDSLFRRTYDGLFPTFFAMYRIDSLENHQLRLNYGRRIDRPYYQDLNPFITPLNKFTFYVGNPFLLPSFSNKIEMSYIFKKRTTATIGYSSSRDEISETIEIQDGLYYSRPGNIGSTEILNVSMDGNYDLNDWFSLQFYGSLDFVHVKSDFYDGPLEHRGTNGYLQGLASFELPKDWIIQLDGNYQTKITNAQFVYGSKSALIVGVSKKVGERSSLRLSIRDLFYTNINKGVIRNLELTQASYRNLGDTRKVLLSYSFNLGSEFAEKSRHEAKGAEDEKNRVKQ